MSKPTGFLVKMLLFVLAVIGVAMLLADPLILAFEANPAINGLILGVLMLSIVNNFRQVASLFPEIHWIESYRSDQTLRSDFKPPKLLSPMAAMIGEKRDRLTLSTMAMRSVLDGIGSRLDESRDVSRYTIGLLIFLGLLGTFWGLLETVQAIGGVIGNLNLSGDDTAAVFQELKDGLKAPLDGMGTAFSSSLFGLAGSLALGFLDLQSSQAQNRFYNELEDWLSSLTSLTSGSSVSIEGEGGVPFYVQALLEQTAENLENLQRILSRGEESRIAANNNIVSLTEQLGQLSDQMSAQQEIMSRLASDQEDLRPVLSRLAESGLGGGGGGIDETTRAHIRNLDVHMGRLFEELSVGREDSVRQIRSEIKVLTRTLAALAEPVESD